MRQKEGIYMTHFYIIRHGETVFNRKGRIQGWCDSPLTDLVSIPLSEVHAIRYRSPHNPLKKSIFF